MEIFEDKARWRRQRNYLYDLAKRNPYLVYQKWSKNSPGGEGGVERLEASS